MENLSCQKALFNLEPDVRYINCAYMSPILQSMEQVAQDGLIRKRNPQYIGPEDYFNDSLAARTAFAKLVRGKAEDMALIPSTSYGFAALLHDFNPAGRHKALVIANEFPSAYFSAANWAQRYHKDLITISPDSGENRNQNWNAKLLDAIDENTAFVLVSSVHWMDGTAFDLDAIGQKCRAHGVRLLVDGTQSVGIAPMDLGTLAIDALVCACYKWLFGPYSTAIMYVGEAFQQQFPIENSWMNRSNATQFARLAEYDMKYSPAAGRFNVGQTNDFIKTPMLAHGFEQLYRWGVSEMQNYCRTLMLPLKAFLHAEGLSVEDEPWQAAHILSVQLDERMNAEKLQLALRDARIHLSMRGNAMRVSPHIYNDAGDMNALIGALKSGLG